MFEHINLEGDIESILAKIESNNRYAAKLRIQIQELQMKPTAKEIEKKSVPTPEPSKEENQSEKIPIDERIQAYIKEYQMLSGDDIETMMALLPDPDDFEYTDIIYRLQAESLREIKEMTEIAQLEDATLFESAEFIENEKKKIQLLRSLLIKEEEEEIESTEENIIVMVPTENGRIRIYDEIEHIPSDYYDEIFELIQSIINGSFKGRRRFNNGVMQTLGGVSEVRGNKGRVLFQRLNHNTYAVFSTFLKKTTNDRGYQELLKNRIGEYKKVAAKMKECIKNPKFMEMNEELVQELWNKLGHGEDEKVLRKDKKSC